MVARGCRIKKVCCASSARNRRSARASGWRLSVVSLMKTCLVVARERSSAMTSGAVAELEVGGPARGGREDQLGDELVVLERGGGAAEEERGRWDAASGGDARCRRRTGWCRSRRGCRSGRAGRAGSERAGPAARLRLRAACR